MYVQKIIFQSPNRLREITPRCEMTNDRSVRDTSSLEILSTLKTA